MALFGTLLTQIYSGNVTLILTGERTVPDVPRENYWFRRHEVAYQWLAANLELADRTLADIGCGEGYGAALLASAGANVQAWDYDAAALDHVTSTYPEVTAVETNLAPFPTVDLDVAVSLQVVEHLWNVPDFFAQIHNRLRPGGAAVIATPNRLTFSPGLGRGERPTNPFHVEEFDAEQLAELAEAAGLVDVQVLGVFASPALAAKDLVARQISAIVNDAWTPELTTEVAEVTCADFEVRPAQDECLDLLMIARKK